MVQPGITPGRESEGQHVQQAAGEIPAYPIENAEAAFASPGHAEGAPDSSSRETFLPQLQPKQPESPRKPDAATEQTPERVEVSESKTPELQTPLTPDTSREGEKRFINPELGQATFSGGVTTQQLTSRVSGYYTVTQGLINDPKSGLLQQTATSGDPTNGTVWQSVILLKALRALWKLLGLV
ncbi:MAG: hypothetical protein QY312_02225 [Candidatus Dojkabacteria bacterium]|nr:MAG: hypothetical protein QY312_02225 [Candidatus Dojkabacteria bacterium]